MKALKDLKVGENGVVSEILTNGNIRRRFIDIGLIKGSLVKCVGISPFGNPKAYLIRGAVIAIRKNDCADILVTNEVV
ncbi:MAG: ferrous iron transport protein A [Clostridia bacterium]|nr:ferrous iron transport protein A [Clostridia bacterium]